MIMIFILIIQPIFNIKGETKALYCSTHKLDGMVNVKDKTCIHPGCTIIPNYNKPGETKAFYCLKHKLDNMVNVKKKICIQSNYLSVLTPGSTARPCRTTPPVYVAFGLERGGFRPFPPKYEFVRASSS